MGRPGEGSAELHSESVMEQSKQVHKAEGQDVVTGERREVEDERDSCVSCSKEL